MLNASDLFDGVVIRPYNSWNDPRLSVETTGIQFAMTGNPLFPSPSPSMEVFSTAVAAYVTALAKAAGHDGAAVAAKDARRVELIDLCVELGHSVSGTAKGDVEALVTTRMPLRKKRKSMVLTAPTNFRIVNGINPGELDLKVDGKKGVVSFTFEYTMDPPTEQSVWVKTICTTSRCTIKGLQPGKKYWFRTSVTGSRGQQIMGDMILSPYVQ